MSTADPSLSRPVRGLDDALALVTAASGPGDLFPEDDAAAARRYRRLARLLHPDTAPAHRRTDAADAFTALAGLWRCRRTPPAKPAVTTRRGTYVLGTILATGDLAVLRETDGSALLKIPRAPADNDLMEREARALARLDREGDPRHRAYAPRLVESFRHRESGAAAGACGGTERRVNVLRRLDGFHTLTAVREAYPDGLDPRDAAWMWRRLLVALGWAHRAGVVHGAVLPDHVMIHPERHGLVLVDWCYSVVDDRTGRVPALVERHRELYPPEVVRRRPATPATDIHMAGLVVAGLMGERAPEQLRGFVRGSTLPAEARRPHDAWRLLAELDEVLERLYGPRSFRPFTMPDAETRTAGNDTATTGTAGESATAAARETTMSGTTAAGWTTPGAGATAMGTTAAGGATRGRARATAAPPMPPMPPSG